MAARVERMKQQLKDGAIAGAANTLRQTEGVAMDPIQNLFPTREPRPAAPTGTHGVWDETFAD
eukprot:8042341-Prorocentrum_lima.AAC.1